ncbi:sulfurtransferase [Salsuginibacillus kocurii]|uniref:sulfurtransferase n=1 Tax=Salsuginibacillus kocurii TaxID=427078 RepID=UPI00037911FC|nr:sulfurtransferase [Salsuginibacillus kocurii]
MKYVLSAEKLEQWLGKENVRIVDCRFNLQDPEEGKKAYELETLPGAVYFDLEEDMSGDMIYEHGGRHPLPEIDTFTHKLEKAGIYETDTVVAFDDQGGAMASRFWWMMRYLGHENIFVLSVPFSEWKKEGRPVTQRKESFPSSRYEISLNPPLLAHLEEVKQKLDSSSTVLVDAREKERYLGERELIDPRAGRIPSAVHFFWKEHLQEDGRFKSEAELASLYRSCSEEKEYIVYCGSGVTACVNILAMEEAGLSNVRLYAGSWSDWCSYDSLPIEQGTPD